MIAIASIVTSDQQDIGGPLQPMLIVRDLKKHFPVRKGGVRGAKVHAVDGVSFEVAKGETLGVVGESGCGKSTLGKLLMHLIAPDNGELIFDGRGINTPDMPLRQLRRNLQMVFQDSASSLNPRLSVESSIAYGPRLHGASLNQARDKVRSLLEQVGLRPEVFAGRYPHELSGGQKQRVNIARALAVNPRMVILDESVSALDKSVEAQILNLLRHLREQLHLTYIFISHDLNVVRYISDRVLVMYLGKIVEIGNVDQIYQQPRHPYTKALLKSRLSASPDKRIALAPLAGDPPNPINPPPGCRFQARCAFARDLCATTEPVLRPSATANHQVACHFAEELTHVQGQQ